jgi:hypothetical protein
MAVKRIALKNGDVRHNAYFAPKAERNYDRPVRVRLPALRGRHGTQATSRYLRSALRSLITSSRGQRSGRAGRGGGGRARQLVVNLAIEPHEVPVVLVPPAGETDPRLAPSPNAA